MLYKLPKLFPALLIIVCLSKFGFAQALKYKEVTNQNLVYILNNMELASKYQSTDSDFFVNIFYVNYSDGSRDTESCDASTTVYIAISEDGEAPEQHLYMLTKLFDVKFIKWIPKPNGVGFMLSYWDKKLKRKTSTFNLTLKSFSIVNQPVRQSSPKRH
ncbi:hypothetical protein BDD43_2674 [Mucilaginibacter gracilis]|uniref:Uncharacterized protein n=1 Tax=Mucilaginibacter gracilis TaxID=423350 RepID=A0A495J1I5_9SPHI|nr:hypothetical protein [Mucilaginibacter gracilis]RKR82491.1 hypothetical protein BDD43_2674 [Mucilaginibacter gracilis]